jgi:hypothetical protein
MERVAILTLVATAAAKIEAFLRASGSLDARPVGLKNQG